MEFFQEMINLQLISIEKLFHEMNHQIVGREYKEEILSSMSKIQKIVYDLMNKLRKNSRGHEHSSKAVVSKPLLKPRRIRRHSFSNNALPLSARWSLVMGKQGIKPMVERPLLKVNEIIERFQKKKAFSHWKKKFSRSSKISTATYSTDFDYSPKVVKDTLGKFHYYSDNDDDQLSDLDRMYSPGVSDIEKEEDRRSREGDDDLYPYEDTQDNIFSASNGELLNLDSLNNHYVSRSDFAEALHLDGNGGILKSELPLDRETKPMAIGELKEEKKPRQSISKSILESLEDTEKYLKSTVSATSYRARPEASTTEPVQSQFFSEFAFDDGLSGGFEFSP